MRAALECAHRGWGECCIIGTYLCIVRVGGCVCVGMDAPVCVCVVIVVIAKAQNSVVKYFRCQVVDSIAPL